VVYTYDNWVTTLTLDSIPVGYPGCFADIPTGPEQEGTIIFTLTWPGQGQPDRWLKRNIELSITAPPPPVTA
jgi:glucoamylase